MDGLSRRSLPEALELVDFTAAQIASAFAIRLGKGMIRTHQQYLYKPPCGLPG